MFTLIRVKTYRTKKIPNSFDEKGNSTRVIHYYKFSRSVPHISTFSFSTIDKIFTSQRINSNKIIMKFLTLLAAAMVSGAVADDRGVCKDWHPTIFNRINAFCLKTDIVVPSKYAEKGAGTNPTGRVWITSTYISPTCNPLLLTPFFLQNQSLISSLVTL